MLAISVIVPTRNRPRLLRRCLKSIIGQDFDKHKYEIIVVDDGSDTADAKNVANAFSKKFKNIKYIRQNRSGPAAARNLGIKISSAPILAFIDDDCAAERNWLKSIDAAFSRNKDAWAVEGKTLTDEKIGPFSHYIINKKGGMYVTCNMAFRKKFLKLVGGFDETFRCANREDADVAFSIIEKGGRISFCRSAVVRHAYLRSSFSRELRRKTYYMWDILLAKKHPQLYRKNIRYPSERFTPFYIIFLLLSFLSPYFLLCILPVAYAELAYRKYSYSVPDYVGFLFLQTIGSFLTLASVLYGSARFRFNLIRLVFS
jgi:hypothetical protein